MPPCSRCLRSTCERASERARARERERGWGGGEGEEEEWKEQRDRQSPNVASPNIRASRTRESCCAARSRSRFRESSPAEREREKERGRERERERERTPTGSFLTNGKGSRDAKPARLSLSTSATNLGPGENPPARPALITTPRRPSKWGLRDADVCPGNTQGVPLSLNFSVRLIGPLPPSLPPSHPPPASRRPPPPPPPQASVV